MAELDPQAAQALCRALNPALAAEIGNPVGCRDVSAQQLAWDIEAVDLATQVIVRRVSNVRCVSEHSVRAMAEVTSQLWPALEKELAERGVTDCAVSFGTRELPKSKAARREVACLLADRIMDHTVKGTPLRHDEIERAPKGRRHIEDPITRYFYSLQVVRLPGSGSARVFSASDDRVTEFVRPLCVRVLPTINRKRKVHGGLWRDLTLVVLVGPGAFADEEIQEVRAMLSDQAPGFQSIYLARRSEAEKFDVARVF